MNRDHVDVNKPVTNLQLVKSIEKLADDYSTANEHEFLRQWLDAHFLAPVVIEGHVEEKRGREGDFSREGNH